MWAHSRPALRPELASRLAPLVSAQLEGSLAKVLMDNPELIGSVAPLVGQDFDFQLARQAALGPQGDQLGPRLLQELPQEAFPESFVRLKEMGLATPLGGGAFSADASFDSRAFKGPRSGSEEARERLSRVGLPGPGFGPEG